MHTETNDKDGSVVDEGDMGREVGVRRWGGKSIPKTERQ